MRRPQGPFLELDFYFHDWPEREAFGRIVTALVEMGASFTGEGRAHVGPNIRDHPFSSITEELLTPVPIANAQALTQHLADPNIRLVQVDLAGATGIVHNVAEIVTYLSISPAAAGFNPHPLAIWTEGSLFSYPDHRRRPPGCWKAGRRAYQRFRKLIEVLRPAYAAITFEWDLECPFDLHRNPCSLAFRDFFASGTYVDLESLRYLFKGAYSESIGDGLFISCSAEFNPMRQGQDISTARAWSVEAARLIASSFS